LNIALVELKAKISDIDEMRMKILRIGAIFTRKYAQKDTYFNVDQGRLKIRETDGKEVAEILFYERPDVPEIKRSNITLLETHSPTVAIDLFSKLFPIKNVVKKTREVYRLEDTQIHLDSLAELGTFLEFEHPVIGDGTEVEKARKLLEDYCKRLGIEKQDLQAYSYADLLSK